VTDVIRESFLLAQERDALQLASDSDIVSLEPLGQRPFSRYVLEFNARSVVTGAAGPLEASRVFAVGVWFPSDYLHRVVAPLVLTWLAPNEIHHPNVRSPQICLGTLRPGTPLVEICFRLYAVISYQNFGLASPLNVTAAAWARSNLQRFPVDPRPLKRRVIDFKTQVFERRSAP